MIRTDITSVIASVTTGFRVRASPVLPLAGEPWTLLKKMPLFVTRVDIEIAKEG